MKTTINKLTELLGNNYEKCESPSLRHDKYLLIEDTAKGEQIQALISCSAKYTTAPKFIDFPQALTLVATLKGNLIVNHSGGILENVGLCLNPFHGYAMIPGSALKGVSSMAAWRAWEDMPSDELALQIRDVFGYPTGHRQIDSCLKALGQDTDMSGHVCFLPALPLDKTMLVNDVCTCHHPQYYQGKQKEATDNEDPNPQFFPAVKEGVDFVFRLMLLRNCSEETKQKAKEWLIAAITVYGLGAKTAAGYGWFDYDETISENKLRLQQEALRRKKEQAEKDRIDKEEKEKKERAEKERLKAKEELEQRWKAMTPEEKADTVIDYWLTLSVENSGSPLITNQFESFTSKLSGNWKNLPRKSLQNDVPEEDIRCALIRALKGRQHDFWLKIVDAKKTKNVNWPDVVTVIRKLHKQYFNGEKMS